MDRLVGRNLARRIVLLLHGAPSENVSRQSGATHTIIARTRPELNVCRILYLKRVLSTTCFPSNWCTIYATTCRGGTVPFWYRATGCSAPLSENPAAGDGATSGVCIRTFACSAKHLSSCRGPPFASVYCTSIGAPATRTFA